MNQMLVRTRSRQVRKFMWFGDGPTDEYPLTIDQWLWLRILGRSQVPRRWRRYFTLESHLPW